MDGATLRDGWADALGQILDAERREWQRARALTISEHRRHVAELRLEHAEAIQRIEERVNARLVELRDGKDGEPGAAGEPGPPGERGPPGEEPDLTEWLEERRQAIEERVDHAQMLATLDELAKRLEQVRDGRDGKDGEQGPQGPPGSLPVAEAWSDKVWYAGAVTTHHGASWQAIRDTGREPPHDDWIMLAAAGTDAPVGEVCGAYAAGRAYRKFDLVCHDGCEWRARRDDPGPLPGDGWALSAVQGKRGGRGEQGERGLPGERGPAGAPAPLITDWIVDGYRATPLLGDGTLGPALDMRQFFELYHGEAR